MIKVECKRCLAVSVRKVMGRDYVNLHSRKRLEGVLQELSGIIADLQDV